MSDSTELLIIGGGPFGLALSAYARRHGIEHVVVGEPMEFWRSSMPSGMYLRSDSKWHLDPMNEFTIEKYLRTLDLSPQDVEPLSLELYLEYCDWFVRARALNVVPLRVERLDYDPHESRYEAALSDGSRLIAKNVAIALGMGDFAHVPTELAARLPAGGFVHTRHFVDFSKARGKRLLIVGGRQGAFEWAALLRESGATAVYLSYRHDTPSFVPSEWAWVDKLVDDIAINPAWYRELSGEEKEAVKQRLWAEGRHKLEPWLAPRIVEDVVRLFPRTELSCVRQGGRRFHVTLTDGTELDVDDLVLATGYKVDVARIPFLAGGSIPTRLATSDGYPKLNEKMESSVPGLFFTSACAVQDFGPFFGFTVAVRTSATLIGRALAERLDGGSASLGSSAAPAG